MRVLGMDTGVANFAVVLLGAGGKCEYASMFHNTISSMAQKDLAQRRIFRRSMRRLLSRLKPDAVLMEQFVVRGFGSNNIELIGIMIGGIQVMAENLCISERTVMASTWKQKIKRAGHDLQSFYDDARRFGVPPHIVDATLIATYMQGEQSFDNFSLQRFKSNIRRASELLSDTDKIKPKRVRNEVPRSRSASRRKLSKQKMLVLASKSSRKMRSRRRR